MSLISAPPCSAPTSSSFSSPCWEGATSTCLRSPAWPVSCSGTLLRGSRGSRWVQPPENKGSGFICEPGRLRPEPSHAWQAHGGSDPHHQESEGRTDGVSLGVRHRPIRRLAASLPPGCMQCLQVVLPPVRKCESPMILRLPSTACSPTKPCSPRAPVRKRVGGGRANISGFPDRYKAALAPCS